MLCNNNVKTDIDYFDYLTRIEWSNVINKLNNFYQNITDISIGTVMFYLSCIVKITKKQISD